MHSEKLTIITADAGMRLVWRESVSAFSRLGHTVAVGNDITRQSLARTLALPPERSDLTDRPSLFFSVNFNGLDKHGEIFAECQRGGLPVAVWCVDNPWNLLSGLRNDFWKKTFLFVTDPSFIPGLKDHGAQNIFFLPLGADPGIFTNEPRPANFKDPATPLVFVGRSAFPDKERFFLGQSVPVPLFQQALKVLPSGLRPDFFWWLERLFSEATPLWPGSAARKASYGAEETSLEWRRLCLEAAAALGLTVYGDEGWETLLPESATLLPPVDYYGSLGRIYNITPFSLIMTSYLLPHGCNQRHFDVWAAGGFAVMDNTPGLDIFPEELRRPVTFTAPDQIREIIARFTRNPDEKAKLAAQWRDLILAEHTYDARICSLMDTVFS